RCVCLNRLDTMNGAYYQDPKAILKQDWDNLVQAVEKAAHIKTQCLEQLPEISHQLGLSQSTKEVEMAQNSILEYQNHEKNRNDAQAKLDRLIAIQKASSDLVTSLLQSKAWLENKLHTLCGAHFGDTNGLLDQAWKKYQTELKSGSSAEE